jgi:hypothetical protein
MPYWIAVRAEARADALLINGVYGTGKTMNVCGYRVVGCDETVVERKGGRTERRGARRV